MLPLMLLTSIDRYTFQKSDEIDLSMFFCRCSMTRLYLICWGGGGEIGEVSQWSVVTWGCRKGDSVMSS